MELRRVPPEAGHAVQRFAEGVHRVIAPEEEPVRSDRSARPGERITERSPREEGRGRGEVGPYVASPPGIPGQDVVDEELGELGAQSVRARAARREPPSRAARASPAGSCRRGSRHRRAPGAGATWRVSRLPPRQGATSNAWVLGWSLSPLAPREAMRSIPSRAAAPSAGWTEPSAKNLPSLPRAKARTWSLSRRARGRSSPGGDDQRGRVPNAEPVRLAFVRIGRVGSLA